jgi:hypothetical protein
MKSLLFFFLLAIFSFQCSYHCDVTKRSDDHCSTLATYRDLTGLDGCGFVLELEDGTRLEPVPVFMCGTPPLPENPPPTIDFEPVDGTRVYIDYEEVDGFGSICMVGKTVRLTCISKVESTEDSE